MTTSQCTPCRRPRSARNQPGRRCVAYRAGCPRSPLSRRVALARYYDPTTGQFLSRDPLVAVTGSAYGYVDDNPLNGTDPIGLSKCGFSLGGLVDCASVTSKGAYRHLNVSVSGCFVVCAGFVFAHGHAYEYINGVGFETPGPSIGYTSVVPEHTKNGFMQGIGITAGAGLEGSAQTGETLNHHVDCQGHDHGTWWGGSMGAGLGVGELFPIKQIKDEDFFK